MTPSKLTKENLSKLPLDKINLNSKIHYWYRDVEKHTEINISVDNIDAAKKKYINGHSSPTDTDGANSRRTRSRIEADGKRDIQATYRVCRCCRVTDV